MSDNLSVVRATIELTRVSGQECDDSRRCVMVMVLARLVVWFAVAGALHRFRWRWVI